MRFHPLEKLMNLRDGYTSRIKIDNLNLLLIQRGEDRYLIESTCPHREHPLEVASIADGRIQCALHQYQFSLTTGEVLASTEEPCRALRTFELIYEGNEVGILLED